MKNIFSFKKLFESKSEVIVVISGVYFEDKKPSLSFITNEYDYFATNGIYISSFTEEGNNEYQLTINCPNMNVANELEKVVTENNLGEVIEVI